MRGLANEIAKNLVLAGIGSLTIVDGIDGPAKVTEQDLDSQFLLTHKDIGKNRAKCAKQRLQKLNPRVKITIDDCQGYGIEHMLELEGIDVTDEDLTWALDWWETFDIVIATDMDFEHLAKSTRLQERSRGSFMLDARNPYP